MQTERTMQKKRIGQQTILLPSRPALCGNAAYVGRKHCITCANGTDALQIAYMLYGIGEGDAVFLEICDHVRKGGGLVVFGLQVFKGGNRPFHPACGRLGFIRAFCARQIQAAAEVVLPRHEGKGKIAHRAPDSKKVPVLPSLGQMRDFGKMSVRISPEGCDEAFSVLRRALFSDDREGGFDEFFDGHSAAPPWM